MKKINLILVLVMSLVMFTACGEKKSSDKLIVALEAGFAPYEYLDNNNIVGVDIDIANAISKELGKEVEIKNLTFDGALLAVSQGKVDMAISGISISEERKKTMDFSEYYVTSDLIMLVKEDNTSVKTAEDIKKI